MGKRGRPVGYKVQESTKALIRATRATNKARKDKAEERIKGDTNV
jgi:hypothetical protein